MHPASLDFGNTGSEELVARRPDFETPEFDITAMVDLVFMMNIYFLVTFVTVAMGELNLPAATHATPLDGETAVILTLTRTLDGRGMVLHVGDGTKTDPINDPAQQEQKIQAAVEQGVVDGKKTVLLKAEKKVRLADLFRVATAASSDKLKLHIAVMEKDER
jgi:biopolymer transport protein ExbD